MNPRILLCTVAAVAGPSAAPAFARWFPAMGIPRAVAVAPDGNVLVVEGGFDRIEEFTPMGKPVRNWGSNGSGPPGLIHPFALRKA